MTHQCPSCGGFCKKSGCEREDASANMGLMPPKVLMNQLVDDKVDLQKRLDAALAELAEMRLQSISDFGQLQAQEPVAKMHVNHINGESSAILFNRVTLHHGDLLYAAAGARPGFDLITHLHRQIAFSQRTFGPGARTAGLFDHIIKELIEIEEKPSDLTEWVDLILLALDGAWRAGHTAEAIAQGIDAKQTKNEGRTWPDWRTADPGKAIEHVRSAEPAPAPGLALDSGEFVPAVEISYHPV